MSETNSLTSIEDCRILSRMNKSHFLQQGDWKLDNTTCIYFFCSSPENMEWYCYVVAVMCFISLFFGFLGNVVVLINYAYYTKSWTSSTIFIFNLALCDFTWIIILPIAVFFSLDQFALYSAATFCQFKRIFFNINIYGSIFFLMLISFDRYLSSVHPLTSSRWWDKKKARFCTITIWLFILLESIPDIYRISTANNAGNIAECLEYIEEPMSFVAPIILTRMLLGFLLPGIVIFSCYFSSLRVLIHLKDQHHSRKRFRKPLLLVTTTMLVFLISFVPYHIMIMVILIHRLSHAIDPRNVNLFFALYEISQIICSISNCADPFIFILANKRFKNHIKSIKCSLCRCSNRVANIGQQSQ